MVRLLAPLCGFMLVATTNAQVISLGTAQKYAVPAAEIITNTGPTVLDGGIGASPGAYITGFPPGFPPGFFTG